MSEPAGGSARSRNLWVRGLAALAVTAFPPLASALQLEVEDLRAGGEAVARQVYERADERWRADSCAEAMPLLAEAVRLLERDPAATARQPELRDMLAASLFRRAACRLEAEDAAGAESDLRTLLTTAPAFRFLGEELDGAAPGEDPASRLLDRLRGRLVGELRLEVDPPDATAEIDGVELPAGSRSASLVAGERRITLHRPGHAQIEATVRIVAGRPTTLRRSLARIAPALRVATEPEGAEVAIDGRLGGVTPGVDAGDGQQTLLIDGFAPGPATVELRRRGYRTRRLRLTLDRLADYVIGPLRLERQRGELLVRGLPAGARLEVDGKPREISATAGVARVELDPGQHIVRVRAGAAGLFAAPVGMTDGGRAELAVRLRPSLALLGIVGDDRATIRELEGALSSALGELRRFAVLDAGTAIGPGHGPLTGVDAAWLREEDADRVGAAEPKWGEVQRELDASVGASLYLLAVLDEGQLPAAARLWLWAAAPGPARPARIRFDLTDGGAAAALAATLDTPLSFDRAWLGADLVDAPIADGPLVVAVAAGGPAAEAGLQPGDQIVAVDGEAPGSATAARHALLAGGARRCRVRRGAGTVEMVLTPARAPAMPTADQRALPYPAAWAALASGNESAAAPPWLVELHRAGILLEGGAWGAAASRLEHLRAPDGPGVGTAAADYWLAVALARGGRVDAARPALARAAVSPGRLQDGDGPRVAPLARAALGALAPGNH